MCVRVCVCVCVFVCVCVCMCGKVIVWLGLVRTFVCLFYLFSCFIVVVFFVVFLLELVCIIAVVFGTGSLVCERQQYVSL